MIMSIIGILLLNNIIALFIDGAEERKVHQKLHWKNNEKPQFYVFSITNLDNPPKVAICKPMRPTK